jgi:hypothetical protein
LAYGLMYYRGPHGLQCAAQQHLCTFGLLGNCHIQIQTTAAASNMQSVHSTCNDGSCTACGTYAGAGTHIVDAHEHFVGQAVSSCATQAMGARCCTNAASTPPPEAAAANKAADLPHSRRGRSAGTVAQQDRVPAHAQTLDDSALPQGPHGSAQAHVGLGLNDDRCSPTAVRRSATPQQQVKHRWRQRSASRGRSAQSKPRTQPGTQSAGDDFAAMQALGELQAAPSSTRAPFVRHRRCAPLHGSFDLAALVV